MHIFNDLAAPRIKRRARMPAFKICLSQHNASSSSAKRIAADAVSHSRLSANVNVLLSTIGAERCAITELCHQQLPRTQGHIVILEASCHVKHDEPSLLIVDAHALDLKRYLVSKLPTLYL
jgi:hypothetical protein